MTAKYKVLGMKELVKSVSGLSLPAAKFNATQKSLESALNKLASDGHELVQIVPGYGDSYVILKKCK
jgi:hypothetical protein